MFLAVGSNKRRLSMSMQRVYSDEHLYERAAPHLHGSTASLAVADKNNAVRAISVHTGVYLEWAPGKYDKLRDESELRLATRLVAAYHDDLRTESEQLSIHENEWSQKETELLEEAVSQRIQQWELETDSEEDEEWQQMEDALFWEEIELGKVGRLTRF